MLVLVVDDEELVLAFVASILTRAGHSVLLARGAADARRAYAHSKRPLDLVVTDIQMPDGSGFDLSTEFAALQPSLPVLLMSGGYRESDPEVIDHLRPGRAFLEKPFIERSFLTRLAELMPAEGDDEVAVPAAGQ